MARCLVTGGAGFIGSHVAEALLARGDEVVVLDDLSGGREENVPAGATLWHRSVREVPHNAFDAVYHLAAYAAEVKSQERRAFTFENNIVGSAALIEWARAGGCKSFTFVSSVAAAGDGDRPVDPYGISKLATELDLASSGIPSWRVVRLHNVYGPRQRMDDPDRNVVAIFMRQALAGQPMTVYGDGSQRRAFTYVGDVVPRIIDAPDGGPTTIGNYARQSVLGLAHKVAAACGVEARIEHLPARDELAETDVAPWSAGPWTDLEDGLRRTVKGLPCARS